MELKTFLSTAEGIPVLSAILAILITYALVKPRRKAGNEPDKTGELKAVLKGTRHQVDWPNPAQVLGLIQQRRSIFPKVGPQVGIAFGSGAIRPQLPNASCMLAATRP